MRTVGWLGPKLGLQGDGSRQLEDSAKVRLHEASWGLVSMTLGWHGCDFCPAGARFEGNGEYRYYARQGEVYCAPMMIVHYVDEHGYCPPAEFLANLGQKGDLGWDWRADRLASVALDRSEDPVIREDAFSDIAHWREPRALEVLRQIARDEVMISVSVHHRHPVGAGDLVVPDAEPAERVMAGAEQPGPLVELQDDLDTVRVRSAWQRSSFTSRACMIT